MNLTGKINGACAGFFNSLHSLFIIMYLLLYFSNKTALCSPLFCTFFFDIHPFGFYILRYIWKVAHIIYFSNVLLVYRLTTSFKEASMSIFCLFTISFASHTFPPCRASYICVSMPRQNKVNSSCSLRYFKLLPVLFSFSIPSITIGAEDF